MCGLTFSIVSFAFLSPSLASLANFRKVNLVDKSHPLNVRCHTEGELSRYSLVGEQEGGFEPSLIHTLLLHCLQGHPGLPKIHLLCYFGRM